MTDRDPLAPIEALLDDLRMDESPHPMIHGIDRRLRDALAEAREAVEGLVAERDAYRKAKQENDERFMLERDEARVERDRLREALADAHTEHWLAGREVGRQELALLRAALAQPATDEEAE